MYIGIYGKKSQNIATSIIAIHEIQSETTGEGISF